MREAHEKVPMRLIGYCLMTNHFHLLLWPHKNGDLSRWMQWLMTSHVRRYHRHYKGSGHVWQGRFKAFPVQSDEHYLTVLRYVERNPLRANMVQRSQDWEWSSLKPTTRSGRTDFFVMARSRSLLSGLAMSTELKAKPNSRPCDTALLAALHSVILTGRQKRLQCSALNLRFDLEVGQSNGK